MGDIDATEEIRRDDNREQGARDTEAGHVQGTEGDVQEKQGDIHGVDETAQEDIGNISDVMTEEGDMLNDHEVAKAEEGNATEKNLEDAGLSDDADISQPPTPVKEGKRTTEVPTAQNDTAKEELFLGLDGNPITPKYAGGRHEGEARFQENDPDTGEAINRREEATVAKAQRDDEERKE